MTTSGFAARFSEYFSRPIAEKAAKSISNGAQVGIQIKDLNDTIIESLTFTKEGGVNVVQPHPPRDPQISFSITPQAAEVILSNTSEDIGSIGVGILKLVMSQDPNLKVSVKFHAGFLTLLAKGYFGVLTAGGVAVASYLGEHGLNGMSAIKAAFKKLKE